MTFWTEYLPLDAGPEMPLFLFDHYEARRRVAVATLADSLSAAGAPALGQRLASLYDTAPQLLGSATAWQWSREVLAAAKRKDSAAIADAGVDLTRFEVAGAMLSDTSWDGSWPYALDDSVMLPTVDMVVTPSEHGEVSVRDGVLRAGSVTAIPHIRGVTLNAWDLALRGPSRDRFDFILPGDATRPGAGSLEIQIAAAFELADLVCPALAARLRTTIVPVRASKGYVEAGTDEQAPGITYCSFGRSPTDLVAALAHEESHAILNAATITMGLRLPEGEGLMNVPWKPEPRPLPAIVHGLAAFGRASTIRQRARVFVTLGPDEDRLADEEAGWVRDVSEQLLSDTLGKLPADVREWIDANAASLGEPPPRNDAPQLGLIAQASTESPYRWWLLQGSAATAAAARAQLILHSASWHRHVTSLARQDAVDLSAEAHGLEISSVREFFSDTLPTMLRTAIGLDGRMRDLVAHRLRRGDAVGPHNDADQHRFDFRCILGVTPGTLVGGQLRLWGASSRPVMSLQPGFGDVLVLEANPFSFHEVDPVRDDRWRLSIVGSYVDLDRDPK